MNFYGFTLVLFLSNILALCSPIHASTDNSAPSWQQFKSEPGRFSVEMPAEPQPQQLQTTSFIGTIIHYVFVSRDDDEVYTVSYSDLPGFALTFTGRNTIYNHAKGALLLQTLGKEFSYQDTTLNGIRGKHLVYDMPDPKTDVDVRGEAHFFLVDKRLYVIDTNGLLERKQAHVKRFLSSFRIEESSNDK